MALSAGSEWLGQRGEVSIDGLGCLRPCTSMHYWFLATSFPLKSSKGVWGNRTPAIAPQGLCRAFKSEVVVAGLGMEVGVSEAHPSHHGPLWVGSRLRGSGNR